MKREFLLEIGSEEIPAWMIPGACQSLGELLKAELKATGVLKENAVETFATPRRLVAYCPQLLPAEPDRVSEIVGPPRAVAFDAAGKPTQAARGFAAKQGVRVESLTVVKTPKGDYVAAVKRTRGRATRQVLGEALPRIIPAIHFPRSMYWTSRSSLRFIRPIRWLVALYAGQVVEFELAGVRSGRVSWGHRVLSGKRLTVRNFRDYEQKLRKAGVLVRPSERGRKIRREQQKLIAGRRLRLPSMEAQGFFGGVPGLDDLLEYAVNSTEYPSVVLGEFSPSFAHSLPQEVLITVMVHHQKYFYLRDARGKLAPYFLAVIDREADRSGLIRRGHERVLEARFRDAEFFWNADRRVKLESRLAALAGVTFAEGLGSYGNKTERLTRLASWLVANVPRAGRRADSNALERAVSLCKTDLTTQLVGEFPELQGIVGGLYAFEQGEEEKVWQAIYEHYRPRTANDTSPATPEGALLALADRMDTVVGCFAVGLIPSGSRDPFGLRRAAVGAVKIILDHRLRLDLREFLSQAAATLAAQNIAFKKATSEVVSTVWEFLLERVRYVLGEFAYDEINAVFAAGASDLVDLHERLKAVHQVRPSAHFEPLSVAFKRIRNILEQAGAREERTHHDVALGLLQPGAERELFEAFDRLRPQVAALRARQQYEQALRLIASLRPQVDRFFDHVLVMTDNAAVRQNRLVLLAHVLQEFSTIADFAEIVPGQPANAGPRAKGR
ncbi:MAG: glycine--tRNA ligase subunit beta [Terriglobia bacterium]